MGRSADEEDARARRAEQRRRTWSPIERVPAGEAKPALHDELTMEQRISRLWIVTRRAWAFAGRTIPSTPRHEWPGGIFEIEHGHGRAAD